MRIVALFLWLALPIAGYVTYVTFGTPHLVVSYHFLDNGDRHNPYAKRTYTRCRYLGWSWHEVTTGAPAGRCPWVRFFHQGSD